MVIDNTIHGKLLSDSVSWAFDVTTWNTTLGQHIKLTIVEDIAVLTSAGDETVENRIEYANKTDCYPITGLRKRSSL